MNAVYYPKIENRDDCYYCVLAFKKTNQNTQDLKNEQKTEMTASIQENKSKHTRG